MMSRDFPILQYLGGENGIGILILENSYGHGVIREGCLGRYVRKRTEGKQNRGVETEASSVCVHAYVCLLLSIGENFLWVRMCECAYQCQVM